MYRAVDQRTREEIALKLLSSGPSLDPIATRRMAREFEALSELSHPNVVRVFDAGVFQGYPFLTMELIEGLTLRDYLKLDYLGADSSPANAVIPSLLDDSLDTSQSWDRLSCFDVDCLSKEPETDLGIFVGEHVSGKGPEALRRLAEVTDEPFTDEESSDELVPWIDRVGSSIEEPTPTVQSIDMEDLNRPERVALLKDALLQICDALAYIHARGMVHRDLKPSNIMVDDDRRVRLMDFGLAKFLADDSAVTAVGHIVGTYRYMSPEQLLGERLDGRADLYSLGVMLYELLAGRPAFDARTPLEMCQQILEHEAVPLHYVNPEVDEQLSRMVQRLMHKDPIERYQTAEEIAEVIFE